MKANRPQTRFLNLQTKFRAFVAGYGSGKSWVGGMSSCLHYYQHPGINQGFFAPTYPQIRDIFYPTISEVADDFGLRVDIKEGNKEVHFYRGRDYKGTTICRSMERPESIVGFKIGHALIDEFDLLDAKKAATAWKKIIARMRYQNAGLKNGVDVTTTPEGFRATYNLFIKQLADKPELRHNYGLVRASTYENARHLPEDYIPSLLEAYPAELIEAYLNGKFVNLTSGTVYSDFDRELNKSTETIIPGEDLHIGMDFNVHNMSAVIHGYRGANPVALEEITKVADTPRMISTILDRYQGHDITVYPDASGRSANSTNAGLSDIGLLIKHFKVSAPKANPRVRNRVVSMNAMFCNAAGERRYKVNIEKCPEYVRSLEQQAYKNGEPEKDKDTDHLPDGAGYFIHRKHPAEGKPRLRIR